MTREAKNYHGRPPGTLTQQVLEVILDNREEGVTAEEITNKLGFNIENMGEPTKDHSGLWAVLGVIDWLRPFGRDKRPRNSLVREVRNKDGLIVCMPGTDYDD